MPRRRQLGVLSVLILLGACEPRWLRVDPETIRPNARTRMQVFTGGRALDLHGVAFSPDAVSGIPYFQVLTCDSCRTRVARSSVDSVRIVNPKNDMPLYLGLGTILVFFLMFNLCQPGGCVPGR